MARLSEEEVQILKAAKAKFDRATELLDNLVRAAETDDATAIEQTAGAGREFLDTLPA